MLKALLFTLSVFSPFLLSANEGEYLICLHGFMGSPWNMHFIGKNLEKEGWNVINWKYQSRKAFIAEHGEKLVEELLALSQKHPEKPIHFVTHSMGALVLLAALNHPKCPPEAKIGRVVLIAPPLKGSSWGRRLSRMPLAKWLGKESSGHELMTKQNFDDLGTFPKSLEKILVIAGCLGFNPFIEGKNDGTIALHETTLDIPHKRIVLKCGHKTIVFSKKVHTLITQFFQIDD